MSHNLSGRLKNLRPVAMPKSLTTLIKTARVKQVPRGQILIYVGDIPHDVYILKKGFVKLYDIDDQGNEKVLHIIKPGLLFPLVFYSDDERGAQWFYSALTDCELYVLSADGMHDEMRSDNELTYYMLNQFSREIHEILVRLSSLGKSNTSVKLVAALKYLGKWLSTPRPGPWKRIAFPVNHQLLADMTGVSRESASIAMKELQDAGYIRYKRQTILEVHFSKLAAWKDG